MNKNDYSNAFVDISNRKRLYFFTELSKILEMYESTNKEVNDLIYWLYALCNSSRDKEPKRTNIIYNVDLKPDKKYDDNTFIRNIWEQDLVIYSITSSICDYSPWENKDVLLDIVKNIYFKLDNIIFPKYRQGLDYANTRYYVEIEYINEKKQKEREEKYNLNFKEENWRA